ncbi:MAG: hypothetical protein FJ279_14895, partial [Planctomycetes bacterium]|nr:hypothetical protein [Planctomycetota bacterium]
MSYLSHLTSLAFVTALLLACAAMGAEKHVPMQADIDQVAVREDFSSVAAWTAQPSWLTNASPTARVTTEAGVACFAVHEPGKGMKWSRKTPEISLSEMPYLVVRYRAESFSAKGTDYFVYLDEGGAKGQCNALRLEDVRTDEQWHTVAVNGLRVAAEPHVKAIAIQVQSLADGKARVWVDWLMFSDRVPEGATELRAAPRPPAAPDWVAPLENATWNH